MRYGGNWNLTGSFHNDLSHYLLGDRVSKDRKVKVNNLWDVDGRV